jgi:hypothetical protein
MSMKGSNTLRVEACAFGRFYCSGNDWSRVTRRADGVVSSWLASSRAPMPLVKTPGESVTGRIRGPCQDEDV